MLSNGKATLNELQTVYGLMDLHLMLEVIAVDGYNQRLAMDAARDA